MNTGLKDLKPTTWYKALILVSAAFASVGPIANKANVAITAAGFLIIGFGEWINHPTKTAITRTYRFSYSSREASLAGIVIEAVGALVVIFGVYRLAQFGM